MTVDPLDIAIQAALEAGRAAHRHYTAHDLAPRRKRDKSLVTEADTEAEARVIEHLRRAFGDEPIVGEETHTDDAEANAKAVTAERCWVIDPIDGTLNFICGSPDWAVAIARLERGRPTLGVCYFPARGDLLYAAHGERLQVQLGPSHASPLLATEPDEQAPVLMVHESFFRRFRLRRPLIPRMTGCTVLNVVNVLTGAAHAAVTSAHIWDFAAPLALCANAGIGLETLADGRPMTPFSPQTLHMAHDDPWRVWALQGECLVGRPGVLANVRPSIQPLVEADPDTSGGC